MSNPPTATDPAAFVYGYEVDFGGSGATFAALDSVASLLAVVASVGEYLIGSTLGPVQTLHHFAKAK